ncbi:MAG TPA: MoaD/ThiS family protein [Planctomycetaceae bacterium]|nr:MoaD/ThiS family protein [Planctomycetaceae bacterium]
MTIAVRLFARARDLAGADGVEVCVDAPATVGDVRDALMTHCPKLVTLGQHLLAAVNSNYANDLDAIPAGSEVAFFPPVSGG